MHFNLFYLSVACTLPKREVKPLVSGQLFLNGDYVCLCVYEGGWGGGGGGVSQCSSLVPDMPAAFVNHAIIQCHRLFFLSQQVF